MTDSLFVFLEQSTLFETAPSVVINGHGQISGAYQTRSTDEIQALANSHILNIVLPCHVVNSQIVRLPTLKNATLMLPNILEESLIEPIENLHFVLDKTAVSPEHYVCHYVSKSFLNDLLQTLTTLNLKPNLITSEQVCHNTNLVLVAKNYLLFQSQEIMGSLSEAGLIGIDAAKLSDCECLTFLDSNKTLLKTLNISEQKASAIPFHAHIANQLSQTKPFNLLQGNYEPKQANTYARTLLTWPLLILSLGIFAFTNAWQYHNLTTSVALLKKQNLAYYQTIFPEAKQMISPRFRVEQWLKQHQAEQKPPILNILQDISPELSLHSSLKVLSMQGQNGLVTLVFQIDNFEELNQLKKQIEEKDVHIQQVNAQSENNVINAIWKLSK